MSFMASKRGTCQNIVRKFMLRQIHGGNPKFPHSCLPSKYLRRLCIPLCDIQKNNAFGSGHVLLGFTKCGEYLMSYCQTLQYDNVFGFPSYIYTLHWWRFNLMRPLREVSHVSLFVGEIITEELLLFVCNTLNDRRILIHGYTRPGRDEQSRQCYMTLCPSPPCSKCSLADTMDDHTPLCSDSWAVHMKYNLLPPFPLFIPSIQLKLKDVILLNTVDSLLAVTVSSHTNHKSSDSALKSSSWEQDTNSQLLEAETGNNGILYAEENGLVKRCSKSQIAEKEEQKLRNEDVDLQLPRTENANSISCAEKNGLLNERPKSLLEIAGEEEEQRLCDERSDAKESESGLSRSETTNSISRAEKNGLLNECTSSPVDVTREKEELRLCDERNINWFNNNCKFVGSPDDEKLVNYQESAINHSKLSHLSSFGFKTFCRNCADSESAENSSGIIDGTSCLDIQVTNLGSTPYKLIQSSQHTSSPNNVPVHESPCIHTQVVSLDVEKYISEALNTSDDLKGMYWLLRNYCTQIIYVCDGTESVILQVISLISVQPKAEKITRRRRCSISFLVRWSVSNGEVYTLDISPLEDPLDKSDKQIFEEGRKRVLDLRKKCFVPRGIIATQAFSNHTVFTGTPLEFIKHPFQPIAVVL